ncbi:MAG TPA: hypothetical protein VM286_05065 [Candidatus Thermoplasmatota archaeon]|nr:hypothetical protein [Candidatus Thermoplasmatota archaeon]
MKSLGVLSLLLAATLSGCFTTGGDGTTAPGGIAIPQHYPRLAPPADPMPEGAGHDHTVPDQHKFLWNYEFSARDPLQQNAANIAGLHALDLQNGYLFGAVYGSHTVSADGGLQIWDVHTDPAHPKALGKWTIPGSVGGDRAVGATPDGNYAVIGLEPIDCLGHVNPFAAVNAYLLDTRDKSLPVVSDVITIGGNTLGNPAGVSRDDLFGHHSVFVHRIKDVDYAFMFGDIYRIDHGEGSARFAKVGGINTGHDIYVVDTPWNTTWALSANGGSGLQVFDVTHPEAPIELASWDLPNREGLEKNGTAYYFHTSDATFLPDGQILVVLSSEDWTPHVSPLWVLDGNPLRGITGKPAEPIQLQMLGSWQNPGGHTAAGTSFSLHNPRFHDSGLMTITSYHGGFWQLDMRTPEFWTAPAPLAYAVYVDGSPAKVLDPAEEAIENAQCKLGIKMDTPTYMDLAVGPHGTLYMADVFMGLYTFTPTDDHPVFGTHPLAGTP